MRIATFIIIFIFSGNNDKNKRHVFLRIEYLQELYQDYMHS